jgi:hypothetical protein
LEKEEIKRRRKKNERKALTLTGPLMEGIDLPTWNFEHFTLSI